MAKKVGVGHSPKLPRKGKKSIALIVAPSPVAPGAGLSGPGPGPDVGPDPLSQPAAAPESNRPIINIHHHHYPPRIPRQHVVETPNMRRVSTPVPAAAPARPRPVAPANGSLRFSGNPNAFRFGRRPV